MLNGLSGLFFFFFGQTKKETALNPLIAKLDLPAKLPMSYSYAERQKAVCAMLAKMGKKVSARTVKKISEYYGVDLHGTGALKRSRNPKVFYVRT